MSENIKIIYEQAFSQDDIQVLEDGIVKYAKLKKDQCPMALFPNS